MKRTFRGNADPRGPGLRRILPAAALLAAPLLLAACGSRSGDRSGPAAAGAAPA